MSFSGSEIAARMGVVVRRNAVGLVAWRQGLLGLWCVFALLVSVLTLLVDPMAFAGTPTCGATGSMTGGR